MNLVSLVKKLPKFILIFSLLFVNIATRHSSAVGNDALQQPQPKLTMVEDITFDPSGKLVRLTGLDNNGSQSVNPKMSGIISGVAADNSYAYIVDHVFFHGSDQVGLWIVDFFDPGGPALKGFLNIQLANDVFVRGNYAYVASGYGQFDQLLSIVNVSDPTSPQLVSTVTLTAPGLDVFVDGDYAYVAMGGFGNGILQVVNISNPAAPYKVGAYFDGYGSAGVFEREGTACLADEYGLITLDVADPSSLRLISTFPIGVDDPTAVKLKENIAFVTTERSTAGSLYIIDMHEPITPTLFTTYDLPEARANDLLLLGNYAFIANDTAGLRFMDLSDLHNPYTIDLVDTPGTALDLASVDNNLYLADGDSVYLFTLDLYSVSGRVVDPDGNPLNNFPVSAGSYSHNITDAGGDYTLDGLYEGDYYVQAHKDGYHPLTPAIPVHVPPSSVVPDIIVEVNTIGGQVLAANRLPISGIRVDLSNGSFSYSDTAGRYKISELTEQTYTIVPTATNWIFQPSSATFTIPPYNHRQNFWILPPPQTIELVPGIPAQISYQEIQGTSTIIQFPQDAVSETTTIVLTPQIVQGGFGNKFTGHAFDISAFRGDQPLPDLAFNSPVTVTIEYSDYDLRAVTDEARLNLQTYAGGDWSEASLTCEPPLPYSRDPDNNRISLSVCNSGLFGLFGPTHEVIIPTVIHAP